MREYHDSLAPPTRFDLNFRIGDIPVRVHPYFWLTTVLLGVNTRDAGPQAFAQLLIWTAIVFVSILVHELGHVLMGRCFGTRGHILLTGFCGLAIGASNLPKARQRIAVSLAGPGAGFLLAGVAVGAFYLYNPEVTLFLLGALVRVPVAVAHGTDIPPPLVLHAMYMTLWINVFWGLVNLLPIWPLDGGHVCREICQHFRAREGVRTSLVISIVTAASFAALALIELVNKEPLLPYISLGGSLFVVLFFGVLAFASWQMLQQHNRIGPGGDDDHYQQREPWERDPDWWKHGRDHGRD